MAHHIKHWLLGWLQLVGPVVALLACAWLILARVLGLQLLAVQTGSMCPSFCPGDALIMRRISPDDARPGMVVSYRSSRNPRELVTHRLVYLRAGLAETEGDALTGPDPTVRATALVGRVLIVLPGLGRTLGWLRSWPGLITCVYLPALALVWNELGRFERHWKRRPRYRLIR